MTTSGHTMKGLAVAVACAWSLSASAQGLKMPGRGVPAWAYLTSQGCIASGTILPPGTLALTVTRATATTVELSDGSIISCGANTLPVGISGAEVYGASTNVATTDDLSAAPWTTNTLTVTTGVTDRMGTAYGATLQRTGTAAEGSRLVFPFTGTAAAWTASIDLYAGTATTAALAFWGTNTVAWTATVISGPGHVTSSGAAGSYVAVNELAATATKVALTSTLTAAAYELRVHPETAAAGTNALTIVAALPQIEGKAFATPYISSAAGNVVRNATVATVPLPTLHITNRYCIGVTYKPGQDWAASGTLVLLSNNIGGSANRIQLYKSTSVVTLSVFDGAGAAKTSSWSHGLTGTTSKRVVGYTAGGTVKLYVDGVDVGTPSGAGSGMASATLTPLQVGADNGASQLNGSLSDLKIIPNPKSWTDCQ